MQTNDQEKTRQAFALRFQQALKELGLSPNKQKELGKLFGISGQAVRKWVDGLSMPASTRMPHVAKTLGVRRAWLQDGEGSMYPNEAKIAENGSNYKADAISLNQGEFKLLTGYRKLSTKQKKVITELLNSLLD